MTRIVLTMLFLGFLSLWSLSAQEEADGCRRAFDGIKTSMLTVLGNAQGGTCYVAFDVDLEKRRSTLLERANVSLDISERFEIDINVQICSDRRSKAVVLFGIFMGSGTMSKQKFLQITVPEKVPYMVSEEDLSVVHNMCTFEVNWFLQEAENPRVPDWNPAYAGYQYWIDLLKYNSSELDPSILRAEAFLFSNDADFTVDLIERIEEAESSD